MNLVADLLVLDAADRILRDEVPGSEQALRRVLASERNRTIASLRERLRFIPDKEPAA